MQKMIDSMQEERERKDQELKDKDDRNFSIACWSLVIAIFSLITAIIAIVLN